MVDPLGKPGIKALSPGAPEVWRRMPTLVVPMLAFLIVGPVVVLSRDRVRDRSLVRQQAQHFVDLQGQVIERELEIVTSAVLHLANQTIIRDFFAGRIGKAMLESEYIHFSRLAGVYDQIRLIDTTGVEVLRVDYRGGSPSAVPDSELQSKADRYYYRMARHLGQDEIYVSQFDLNVEHGRIEEPRKSVLRLATPTFDEEGTKRGILVINYLGDSLLERIRNLGLQVPGWGGLVDPNGYYLEAPDPADSWGFMFDQAPTFVREHPQAWSAIRDRQAGTFSTDEGLFTFRMVAPTKRLQLEADNFPIGLKIVSFVPADEIYTHSWKTFQRLGIGTAFVALLLTVVAWRLAYVAAVRHEHERRIAASEKRLRILSRRLMGAQEAERRSLARDLHDEAGQIATAVTINLKQALRMIGQGKDRLIQSSIRGTEELVERMHRIASSLRSSLLDDLGLTAALRSSVEEFRSTTGIPTTLELEVLDESVPPVVAENVYRIVQESLTNAYKHAGASNLSVRVRADEGALFVSVHDTGRGFDASADTPGRLGLLGMRERAELLGGELTIHSLPGEGTRIEARIPLSPPYEAAS